MATSSQPHTAVLIGRFQPLHWGHLALIQQALQTAPQVVIVLGSAFAARSPKNPFTWQERERLIHASLPAADAARVRCVPVRDYYDTTRWVQAVQQAIHSAVPSDAPAQGIALVGHFKDSSSDYLAQFPGWQLISLPRQGDFDGTPVRQHYWNLGDQPADAVLQATAPLVPAPVQQWLTAWMATPTYAAMRAEWRMIAGYHAAWAAAPYPPVFTTVDAVLLCAGHVLLIQRGHAPGVGLWALPGGFLEPRDTLWQSCLRELQEETGLHLSTATCQHALQGVEVFDHPDRSLRGRTITHAHVLHLTDTPLPPVQGGDDAAHAQWVPFAALAGMETQFFEDHFHVLRRCFARFGSGPNPALP